MTSRFGDKGGLIFWANSVGLGERDCDDQVPCAHCGRRRGKSQREASKKAREVGDLGHALIEAKVKGTEINWDDFRHFDSEMRDTADGCLEAFDRWFETSGVDIIETELSLTSDKYRFGGTLDAVGHVLGKFALFDWKSSRGIYSDYVAQVAGYLILVEDAGFPDVEEIHLVRVAKESGTFEHRYFPRKSFQPAIDFFHMARDLYEADKGLTKLMR